MNVEAAPQSKDYHRVIKTRRKFQSRSSKCTETKYCLSVCCSLGSSMEATEKNVPQVVLPSRVIAECDASLCGVSLDQLGQCWAFHLPFQTAMGLSALVQLGCWQRGPMECCFHFILQCPCLCQMCVLRTA